MKTLMKAAVMCVTASGVSAEPASVRDVERYLNSFSSARSEFVQYSSDGSQKTGEFVMQRPGRARFSYDDNSALVLVSANTVSVYDGKSNAGPQRYPLSKTPLRFVLGKTTNLAESGVVVGHGEFFDKTTISLSDPKNPDGGRLELVFRTFPLRLESWVSVSDSGERTTIVLSDIALNAETRASEFSDPDTARR